MEHSIAQITHTAVNGLHSAGGSEISRLVRQLHALEQQRRAVLVKLAACSRRGGVPGLSAGQDARAADDYELISMWSETSETLQVQLDDANQRADHWESCCGILQARIHNLEERCKQAEAPARDIKPSSCPAVAAKESPSRETW